MEIGIIIAFILAMFALALSKTKTGLLIRGVAQFAGRALALSLVVLAALCRPRQTSTVG